MSDLDGLDAEVGDARVVAEQALRPERADERQRRRVEDERKPEPARERPHRATFDDKRSDNEDNGQEDILDPREGGQRRKHGEAQLRAAGRPRERADAEVDGAEHERIGDRVGEHERGEEQVGRGHGQSSRRERGPRAAAEPAHQQIHGNRRDRHRQGVLGLRQAVGDERVVREPERRRQERLEHRRKVRRVATDQRAAVLSQRARDSGVDVLVGKVERSRVNERGDEAETEADSDDPRQQ